MKRMLSMLLMLCCMQTWAQVSDAWKNEIESIFQHVNRTPVTTGLLTDYGIYFTNIDKFNGIPSDTNYIELTGWTRNELNSKVTLNTIGVTPID